MPDLDCHLITRPSERLLEEMKRIYSQKFRPDREKPPNLQTLLRAFQAEHFELNCGGKEAIFHLLLDFFLREVQKTGRNHFLGDEFAPLEKLEAFGSAVKKIPLSPDTLAGAIRPKTSLLTFSWAHPFTGVLQPVKEIVKICHQSDVKVHLNASQVIGKIPISFKELGVDFLSFDSSIPGMGGLFQKEPTHENLSPMAALLAFDIEEQIQTIEQTALETARLRDAFETELQMMLPDCQVLCQECERLPHISAITFPQVMAEPLLFFLERQNVHAAAFGSAISFGLSCETTEDDLAQAVDAIVSSVRKLSPLGHAL